jgi:hypothetical protein
MALHVGCLPTPRSGIKAAAQHSKLLYVRAFMLTLCLLNRVALVCDKQQICVLDLQSMKAK